MAQRPPCDASISLYCSGVMPYFLNRCHLRISVFSASEVFLGGRGERSRLRSLSLQPTEQYLAPSRSSASFFWQ